jgi:pimeloyl-ACP methyl ester carboxylesterase
VLVHGALSDRRHAFGAVRPLLERRVTVYALDRRGHGDSEDASMYAPRREYEDVAAVVAAVAGPVDLIGHSFGALCALEAARAGAEVRRLVLYEGVPRDGRTISPDGLAERVDALVRARRPEAALDVVLAGVEHHGPAQLARDAGAGYSSLARRASLPRARERMVRRGRKRAAMTKFTRRQVIVGAGLAGLGLAAAGVGYELVRSSGSATVSRARFVGLSAQLTGFEEIELAGTGAIDPYYDWLDGAFPDVFEEILDRWPAVAGASDRDDALQREILADPKLGPLARGILGLWYTATWNQLPSSWAKAYGRRDQDVNRGFASTYSEGLMWSAGGLHPQGAKPTGFSTWAFAPARS